MSDSLLESNLAEVSPRQLIWQRFKRHRLAMLSVIFLLLIYLMADFVNSLHLIAPRLAT